MPEGKSNAAESWMPVVGYEGLYEVSDHGRVRSLARPMLGRAGRPWVKRGRVLKQEDRHGYRSVRLCDRSGGKRKLQVHRLVLWAFVGPRSDGQECCHYDCDKANNRLENLRWDTRAANRADSIRNGTTPHGRSHYLTTLTDDDVRDIRRRAASGELQRAIAADFDMTQTNVSRIVTRRSWRHIR